MFTCRPALVLKCHFPLSYLVSRFSQQFEDQWHLYTVFRKKTPTHIFFHISMNYLWI